jgi:hypothetical protein
VRYQGLDESIKKEIKGRASHETVINGVSKMNTYIYAIRFSCMEVGIHFRDLRCIRMLRYYLDTVGPDPFAEFRGGIEVMVNDSMAATRCLMLLIGALHEVQDTFRGWSVLLYEVIEYLFQDPYVNTTNLKSMTSILKQSCFAESSSGHMIGWNVGGGEGDHISDFSLLEDVPPDVVATLMNKEKIEESFRNLRKDGLKVTATAFKKMIKGKMNATNAARMSVMVFIESMAGYFRGNETLSHLANLKKAKDLGPGPENPTYLPKLKELWWKAMTEILARGGFLSYENWLDTLFGHMTTKSAGTNEPITFEVNIHAQTYTIRARDKTFVFLFDSLKFLDRKELARVLTEEDPGRLASRFVPSRAVRTVFMMPLAYYIWETWLGAPLLNWQGDQPFFTITKEIGRFVSDHRFGLIHSSRRDSLIVLMDYSQFDSNQRANNMRKHIIQFVKEFFELHGLDASFGPWENVSEMMETLWSKTYHATFDFGGGRTEFTDQVNSGEFMTITINNMTNKANWDDIEGTLWRLHRELWLKIRQVVEFYMGDDSMRVLTKPDGWDLESRMVIRDVLASVSADNGMELSKYKTSMSLYYYEYLKKMVIRGWIIPRLSQIMILTSERSSMTEPPISQMRSYVGLVREYVSRGAHYDFCIAFIHHVWNIRRKVRFVIKGQKAFFSLEFGLLWTPGELGGIGLVPGSLMGANADAIMYQLYSPEMRDYVSYCAYVSNVDVSIFRRKIAQEVMEGGGFGRGVAFQKARLKPEIVARSRQAIEMLREQGINIGDLIYEKMPERVIRRAIADNPKLMDIVKAEKQKGANLMKSRVRKRVSRRGDNWIYFPYPSLIREFILRCREDLQYTYTPHHEENVWTNYLGKVLVHVLTDKSMMPTHYVSVGVSAELENNKQEFNHNPDIIIEDLQSIPFEHFHSLFAHHPERTIKDSMTEQYKWQRFFFIEREEEVPYRHPVCPIAGLSDWPREVIQRVGISTAQDDLSMVVDKLATDIAKDARVPRDITSEVIFNVLKAPVVRGDVRLVGNILVAMGVSPSDASKFAAKIMTTINDFVFFQKAASYSTRDMIIGHLDLTTSNYDRLVQVPNLMLPKIEAFLRGYTLLYMLNHPSREFLKCRVRLFGDRFLPSLKEIMGEFMPEFSEHMNIYPQVAV